MYPSSEAIAKISAYVAAMSGGWAGNADAAILAAYNAPAVANPTPQGTVATPYTEAELLAGISQASAANLALFPAIDQLYDDITANNTARVAATVALLAQAEKITSGEATAINAALAATELDPSWSSQISHAQSDLGRPADEGDISGGAPSNNAARTAQ